MNTCKSGKRSFISKDLAEDALIEAHVTFNYPTGGGPLSVYCCEDCGCYHFTSAGPISGKLSAAIATGEIRKMKVARQWQQKWQGRGNR